MTRPLFSSSWYRVAALQPRLRSHARIQRQNYRGQLWYVLQDPASERFHRFTPQAYLVIGLMDGQRTVQQLWDVACERLGDDSPTQDELIQLLTQLHAADVLQCDVPPDAAELLERHDRQERRKWQGRLLSFLAWRLPLLDPDRFLRALLPAVRPFMSWGGMVLWLAVVVPAIVLAAVHWTELTQNIIDRLLAPQNFVALLLLFPVIKALHELGHAFVTRRFGGEVHDMGVMLLVVTPVPYVDASSAWAFSNKWQRCLVGVAGMAVELFLASMALYVWLAAEPGLVRLLAYNTMLVAGISSLIFNANPLLRYDGYYILSDFLEIPNLRARANAYVGYLCERYLFGRGDTEVPLATAGERRWFVGYGVASFVYRVLVVIGIVFFIGDHFFWVAVLFAALLAIGWIGVPVFKGVRYLFLSPRIRKVRARAFMATAGVLAVIVLALGVAPLPYRSRAEGIVWIREDSFVRAGTEGFVARLLATPGTRVQRGDALITLEDPFLVAKVAQQSARVRELSARHAEQQAADQVKAAIVLEELRYAQDNLARTQERAADLTVRAGADGTFVVPIPEDLPGRFVKKGELLGYVVELDSVVVRVVVPQQFIDLVRHRTQRVDVRFAERLDEIVSAGIRRLVPGASERLPAMALGSEGGGQFAVDPRDREGVTATEKVFQIDLEFPVTKTRLNVGGRAYVRFDHGWEPLAIQWYQQIRQLFLARFNV